MPSRKVMINILVISIVGFPNSGTIEFCRKWGIFLVVHSSRITVHNQLHWQSRTRLFFCCQFYSIRSPAKMPWQHSTRKKSVMSTIQEEKNFSSCSTCNKSELLAIDANDKLLNNWLQKKNLKKLHARKTSTTDQLELDSKSCGNMKEHQSNRTAVKHLGMSMFT